MKIELQLFSEDCEDALETFQEILHTLKPHQKNTIAIDTLFRAAHTIKGGASMVELDEIIHFTHTLEDLLETIRSNKITINDQIIILLSQIQSHLIVMIQEHVTDQITSQTQIQTNTLSKEIHAIINQNTQVLPQILQSLEKVALRNAKTLDKKITFNIIVKDRTCTHFIQQLYNPLIHMIKNAIDHGIETMEVRTHKHKSETGALTLMLDTSETDYIIQLQDDGMGIDKTRLRQRAIKNEIITAKQNLNEQEILNLIFAPGLSTKEHTSTISGRGVGMDIVKEKLENFSATIEIDSQVDIGTTITIRLPKFEPLSQVTKKVLNNGIPFRAFEKF